MRVIANHAGGLCSRFIIGPSGTGKSTLVNTLRGMRAKDAGAAKTGVTETTHKRQAYDMPNYPYAQIHDLPGGGTKAHPQSTYCELLWRCATGFAAGLAMIVPGASPAMHVLGLWTCSQGAAYRCRRRVHHCDAHTIHRV